MLPYFDLPFDFGESVYRNDFIIASYIAYELDWSDVLKRAGNFAVGQTVGTWLPLPGTTRRMVEDFQARLIDCYPTSCGNDSTFILRIAFPFHNIGSSLAMLLTALIGNDVSTAISVKLLDLEFCGNSLQMFQGPKFGVEGIRRLTGVYDRPLILNMIKPCLGYSPIDGARLFYESGKGGVDLIKDDEVHSRTDVSSVVGRVRANNQEASRIYEEQGRKPVYIVNVTDKPKKMRENIKASIDEGGQAVMVNFVTTGLDTLYELCEEFGDKVFFLAHYAGVGIYDQEKHGIASSVILGKLGRLIGADSVMVMFPQNRSGPRYFEYLKTIQSHRFPIGNLKPTISSIGGGITPLSICNIYKDLGKDVIIGIGGAIQGHPMGTEAGAKAILRAVKAAVSGQNLTEAAKNCPELKMAIEIWN